MDIKGHAAIVTGGGSGLGAATATELAKAGAKVALFDINMDAANELAGKLGGIAIKCDVADSAQGEAALLWLYTSAAGRSALSAAGLAPITGAGTGAGGLAAERITSGECLAAAAVPEAAREALRTRPETKAAFAAAFAG